MNAGGDRPTTPTVHKERLAANTWRLSADALRDITDALPVLIAYVDSDRRYQFANKAYETWFPHRRDDLIGRPIREVIGEAAYAAVAHRMDAAMDGEHVVFEQFMPYVDTRPRHIRVEYLPRRNSDGIVDGFYTFVQDISEQKAAEAALRDSDTKFEAIANSVDQMIWSTRRDGFHDYFNERWYDFTGVPPGSTDGEAWNGLFHPDDQDRAWERWRESLATGKPYHIEYRLRHRSGVYRWVLGRAQPIRNPSGEITRWYGTCTDIQEIVDARDVLARSQEDLEKLVQERTEERDRLWTLSEDMLARANYDGGLVAVNPAWTTVLGYSEHELLTRPYADIIDPAFLDATIAALQSMGETGQPTRFENRVRAANGEWKPIGWTVSPESDGVHFIAVGRDLANYKERERELIEAQEALRQSQKMEAIGQLTGGVAHDFNNLLTVIRSSADLLRRHDLPEERRRRYVDAISDTADRAAKLTGQLLAFARRQALRAETFDVAERVTGIGEILETVLGARVALEVRTRCAPCYVEADTGQFETALINMAVNGRDAMDGEGPLSIMVDEALRSANGRTGSGPQSFVAVSVRDGGKGIAPADLERIFEPFFTTKAVGAGTGLGLSQVYGFAKQSGGEIEVASEIGRGSTFTLYLPRVEGKAAAASPIGAPDIVVGRGRVLVVEDNPQVGEFAAHLLDDLGYEAELAVTGEDALGVLEADATFNLVFSDVVMPGMGGVKLGRTIRERWPNLPVVLTSGYSHVLAEDARHGFPLLHKPYSVEDLSRILRQAAGTATRTGPA